jgi:hypothetical protein
MSLIGISRAALERKGRRAASPVSGAGSAGTASAMTPERDESREPAQIDELLDEFGDRAGPDPTREPELELGDDEVIVEPAADDDEKDE